MGPGEGGLGAWSEGAGAWVGDLRDWGLGGQGSCGSEGLGGWGLGGTRRMFGRTAVCSDVAQKPGSESG